MDRTHEKARAELRELSAQLGLQWEEQDWGIVNADPGRLSEFITFYQSTPGLSPTQRFELGGLILASANEYLVNGEKPLPESVARFLVGNCQAFKAQLEYWLTLGDTKEFPLTNWLIAHVGRPHQ